VKRTIDLVLSFVALVSLSPLLLFLAWQVRRELGAPVLFVQLRPGLNGKPFEMIKFRTMTNEYNVDGNLLPDIERLSKVGRFMRATSLDELPELWNVIKGDMSLVGPRPLLMEYLELYTPDQARRHEERPGITGWAQVNGRNTLGWDEKFALDVWYVDNRSIPLDLKIMLMTIPKVLGSKGIAQEGHVTMEPFQGSKE
jgi:lipopolysaccharide/colanic/teichoic acid biosynthesis glycosyltransferase